MIDDDWAEITAQRLGVETLYPYASWHPLCVYLANAADRDEFIESVATAPGRGVLIHPREMLHALRVFDQ